MKTIVLCTAFAAALTISAQAGPRGTCGLSTGLTIASPLNACAAAPKAVSKRRTSSGSFGRGSGRRGACRQSGTC